MAKVNGYTLHKRVLKRLTPDHEPTCRAEAIFYIAWLEYLLGNPPKDLDGPGFLTMEQWEADLIEEIAELKDKYVL